MKTFTFVLVAVLMLFRSMAQASPLTDCLIGLALVGNGVYFENQRNADDNHVDESRIAQNRAFYFFNQQEALGLNAQKNGSRFQDSSENLWNQIECGNFNSNGNDYLIAFLTFLRYRQTGKTLINNSGAYFNQASIELDAQTFYQAQELDYRNRQATDKMISLTSFAVGSFFIIKSIVEYHQSLSQYPKHAGTSKFRWAFNGSQLKFGVRI